jgi:Protein of unknown function (DUF2985)
MDNLVKTFTESSPPLGFTYATGTVASSVPSVRDVRRGSYDSNGWSAYGQRRNSAAGLSQTISNTSARPPSQPVSPAGSAGRDEISRVDTVPSDPEKKFAAIAEGPTEANRTASGHTLESETPTAVAPHPHDPNVPYPNGYQFPPPYSIWKSIQIASIAFAKFVITPIGFFITIYALNIVAWGGMLFLLLCGAAPAMCHPSCDDDYSGKKIWIEIDSQILNALFCVTGLGLIPWRFRDLYYLMQYRLQKKESGIRRLAGIHNDWFRLKGSQEIPIDWNPETDPIPEGIPESVFALPVNKSPPPPLTGERAPPTKYWKMDFMIWCYVWNTLLQICLCGIMWGLNRFTRPGWTTGLLIGLACVVAGAGGYMAFREGKAVKKIEGVPVSKEDMEILARQHDVAPEVKT